MRCHHSAHPFAFCSFPPGRYSSDAATAIAVVLSSCVVSRIDPRLAKLIINSPGYLDMARFGLGSTPSSTSSTMNTRPGSSGYQSGVAGAIGLSSNTHLSVLMHSNLAYSSGARIVAYNARYELVKSYPTLLVIPAVRFMRVSTLYSNTIIYFRPVFLLYLFWTLFVSMIFFSSNLGRN